ncbi:MAG: gamma-glutamyl-gamma-aminobutyrate hydrolase family protein [Planctomycetota bacterium]|nr:gamma-glutamyl-gamma-aminobutyrate hydrolase family protein [Planctomycetota bacterium]
MNDDKIVEPCSQLVRACLDAGRPVLGICYGHQLIVRALLGKGHVRRSATPEAGWLRIDAAEGFEDIYGELGRHFFAFVGHFDEVFDLPSDWRVTASSPGVRGDGLRQRRLKCNGLPVSP